MTACGGTQKQDKTYTIGIITDVPAFTLTFEGLKAEMAKLGYVEGKNARYIYNGVVGPDPKEVDAEIKNLLAQDVDLLFSVGNLATLRAKQAVEGTDIPIVFGAANPVEEGLVESISHPGGNLTGVQVGAEIPKALDFLVTITPDADKVYLPYNPNDEISAIYFHGLERMATQLGIQFVLGEVYSVEEAVTAIEGLPEDIDAIFRIPSPTLDPRNNELSQAAIKRGLPMGSGHPLDDAMLITLANDNFDSRKRLARLAHQIFQGVKPANLPVETIDFLMTVNLKTAAVIGIDIPDDILRQADTIIR